MSVEEHRREGADDLGFLGVTVTSSRGESDDVSGALLRRKIGGAGYRWVASHRVSDDVPAIREITVRGLEDEAVDVVVLTGGTGFSPADLTVEAVVPLFDRIVDGFGELFRSLSYEEIGPAAMLSRACAGLARGKAVFALPGSPKAVELALDALILPEVSHLLGQARRVDK
ncbi:MAG: MogA/MoaB family molybdenum cofactor biosynthesis protein [Acidobacteriota bacterium]